MIKVKLASKQWDNLIIQIHSQMTAKELRQFIQASTILQGDTILNSSRPLPLVLLFSNRKNLFMDYLLIESNVEMSKIVSLDRIITPSISIDVTSKQSNFIFFSKNKAKRCQTSQDIELEMIVFDQNVKNSSLVYLNLAHKR